MKLFLLKLLKRKHYILALFFVFLICSCKDRDNTLAPYDGSPAMSNVVVEGNTYTPKITWVGGYASVVGVNRGSFAALDSSLVWLIYEPGNTIHYPVTYNQLPEGATDITSQYGGNNIPLLVEDQTYNYWVMKEEMWNQVKGMNNKVLRVNDSLASGYQVVSDTIEISHTDYYQVKKNIDKYVNIYEISYFGLPDSILAHIEIIQTDTSNSPLIKWTITEKDSNGVLITDSLISAIGIVEGTGYQASKVIWEVYSKDFNGVDTVYGKSNRIPSPVYPPSFNIPGTHTFKEYPAVGLERNKGYYIWIAAKQWDQKNRFRFTHYYAYITFKTN